jgi:hypothetical protein
MIETLSQYKISAIAIWLLDENQDKKQEVMQISSWKELLLDLFAFQFADGV